jgi:hypothetical protein
MNESRDIQLHVGVNHRCCKQIFLQDQNFDLKFTMRAVAESHECAVTKNASTHRPREKSFVRRVTASLSRAVTNERGRCSLAKPVTQPL